ncbi:universal stress protein [Rhodopseudomonas pseudopalustris]|uniref:Universal stress protein family protein n=1 Tax=Rhodopseudomonas pseudopalustris TaxID=1513892 RepID=A0A1H8X1U3_9BRAD|nr:universal stress protein [Rhodopseudomonas pseudopalustris]SEP33647.1 Universal stress protein family protein [Rhodopseudomonas pseudopalustris]
MTNYRDIVVDASPRADLHRTLEFARDMTKMFSAKLSAASYAWPRTSIGDVLVHNTFRDQEQTILMERALKASRSVFDEVFAKNEETGWQSGIGEPTLAMQARLLTADLLITDSAEEEACVLANPAHVALGSGAPVLRLGRAPRNPGFSNVVVAWKDSPHACRAVHDALPILKRADSVAVIGVGDELAAERLEAVTAHLQLHAVKARPWHISDTTGDVCLSLLKEAQHENAQLIVTGAYSRGPLTERVLGGVTASMLKNAEISWFMSH